MIEYDPALLQRAAGIKLLALDVDGILTDGRLYFDHQGHEMKAFNTRDGLGMKALQKFGLKMAIITGRESLIVTQRATQLEVDHVYQGRLDKLNAYHHLLETTGLNDEDVCYAGDDLIDLPVLNRVGLSVTVADAHPRVQEGVHWITQRSGGQGAVREICDLILRAQNLEDRLLEEIMNQ